MTKVCDRNKLYAAFHSMLHKLGIMDNKCDILSGYGVESTTDLTDAQLVEVIARLSGMLQEKKAADNKKEREWRSNCLTVLTSLGVYVEKNSWPRVNRYLLDERIAGKLLYEMSVEELKELHRKLLAINEKHKKSVANEKRLTINN